MDVWKYEKKYILMYKSHQYDLQNKCNVIENISDLNIQKRSNVCVICSQAITLAARNTATKPTECEV